MKKHTEKEYIKFKSEITRNSMIDSYTRIIKLDSIFFNKRIMKTYTIHKRKKYINTLIEYFIETEEFEKCQKLKNILNIN